MALLSDNGMYIASVVATYWFVSISMVYLNKVLMSSEELSIPAPLFVTWFQCVVTCFICFVAGMCGEQARNKSTNQYAAVPTQEEENESDTKVESKSHTLETVTRTNKSSTATPTRKKSSNGTNNSDTATTTRQPQAQAPSFWTQFPKPTYQKGTAKRILPLSVIFVGMITFNNLSLKWVQVSFYNVARSLTIVFNVMFSLVILKSKSSTRTMACLAIVVFGFALGSKGEVNFSLKGTIAGVCSSLFVSLNSIYTKKVLPAVNDNHWKLTFYNNVNASVLFLPLIYIFEYDVLSQHLVEKSLEFWSAMMVAGVFGFSIGIVTVLQIKATSPLSHNISGTAKAAFQSMLAFYIWKNKATLMGVMGIFVTLGGSLLYTLAKMDENAKAKLQQELSSAESKENGAALEEGAALNGETKSDEKNTEMAVMATSPTAMDAGSLKRQEEGGVRKEK